MTDDLVDIAAFMLRAAAASAAIPREPSMTSDDQPGRPPALLSPGEAITEANRLGALFRHHLETYSLTDSEFCGVGIWDSPPEIEPAPAPRGQVYSKNPAFVPMPVYDYKSEAFLGYLVVDRKAVAYEGSYHCIIPSPMSIADYDPKNYSMGTAALKQASFGFSRHPISGRDCLLTTTSQEDLLLLWEFSPTPPEPEPRPTEHPSGDWGDTKRTTDRMANPGRGRSAYGY